MTIIKRPPNIYRVIDLAGPEGNLYELFRLVEIMCSHKEIDPRPIVQELTTANQESHAKMLALLDQYFGDICVFYDYPEAQ
ncbi:hypothetical protein [Quatrionicoccus australiensis]|uniref:hypothetical protein n=1 Tax=Quatrionicoccus australiensis TaxID=138118 RepID=UPI001CF98709|nr:hypothetical protein [Quatrionicoccus australiensis]MCB4359581.1 hypothetical protein [Quatrionicoccus australiensis]